MQILARAITGIIGLLALFFAVAIWIHPDQIATKLGLVAINVIGTATLSADVAGFFVVAGLFALGAALRNEARYAAVVVLMMAAALAGRIMNVALRGFDPALLQAMSIEAGLIAVFLLAWRVLGGVKS